MIHFEIYEYTVCLSNKCTNLETVYLKIIRVDFLMTFGRNILKTLE